MIGPDQHAPADEERGQDRNPCGPGPFELGGFPASHDVKSPDPEPFHPESGQLMPGSGRLAEPWPYAAVLQLFLEHVDGAPAASSHVASETDRFEDLPPQGDV